MTNRLLLLATLCACACPVPAEEPQFSVAADHVDGGVLLSAWSQGDNVVFVGGQLSSAPGDEPGGPGAIVTYDAQGLCVRENASDRVLWWIDGTDTDDYYAVGEQGTILHFQGDTQLDESVSTPSTLYGIWAGDPHPIAVGGDVWGTRTGEIWQRSDSGQWLKTHDLPSVAFKIWRDVVVGDGFAGRLDGGTLTDMPLPVDEALLTVRGRADDDVWAAGGRANPVLMHYDGDGWTAIPVDKSCATGGLNGLYTAAGEDVWVAGNFGAAARFDGKQWHCERPALAAEEHFHMVWGHGEDVFFSGGNLFSPGNNYGTLVRYGPDVSSLSVRTCDE